MPLAELTEVYATPAGLGASSCAVAATALNFPLCPTGPFLPLPQNVLTKMSSFQGTLCFGTRFCSCSITQLQGISGHDAKFILNRCLDGHRGLDSKLKNLVLKISRNPLKSTVDFFSPLLLTQQFNTLKFFFRTILAKVDTSQVSVRNSPPLQMTPQIKY